jgi:hypothetical protein
MAVDENGTAGIKVEGENMRVTLTQNATKKYLIGSNVCAYLYLMPISSVATLTIKRELHATDTWVLQSLR